MERDDEQDRKHEMKPKRVIKAWACLDAGRNIYEAYKEKIWAEKMQCFILGKVVPCTIRLTPSKHKKVKKK